MSPSCCYRTARGSKMTHLPLPAENVAAARVVLMSPREDKPEGTFAADARCQTMVLPGFRMVLTLQVEEMARGIDGINCRLTPKSLEAVQRAHETTRWPQGLNGSAARTSKRSRSSNAQTFQNVAESNGQHDDAGNPCTPAVPATPVAAPGTPGLRSPGMPATPKMSRTPKAKAMPGTPMSPGAPLKVKKALVKQLHLKAAGSTVNVKQVLAAQLGLSAFAHSVFLSLNACPPYPPCIPGFAAPRQSLQTSSEPSWVTRSSGKRCRGFWKWPTRAIRASLF